MSGRALVTGSTGFVGGHLVRRLLRDGWAVAAVVRPSSTVPDDVRRSCTLVPADDPAELARLAGDFAPDVCFHLATHFVGVHGPADVEPLLEANVGLGTRLADALARAGEVAFVNVGTIWQHEGGRGYGPTSLYAATKQAFADVLQYYGECTPLKAVTVELSDTYGPDDRREKLLQLLVRAQRTGVPLDMSPGEQLVAFTHVRDVVDALLAAVPAADSTAPVFSLPAETLTVREFTALVGEVLGGEPPVRWGARPYRPREMMASWACFPPLPGWRPATSLRDGLAEILALDQSPPSR